MRPLPPAPLEEAAHFFTSLPNRFRRWGLAARSLRSSRLSFHEAIAPAISRNAQEKWLQFFVDTQAHGSVFSLSFRFDLPPLAIFAQTPWFAHRRPPFK